MKIRHFTKAVAELHFAFAAAAVVLVVLGASSQVARAQTCVTPPANMVAWYPGDDNAADITSFHNDGTLHGGATFAPGEVKDAFSLDGSTGYVSALNAPQINFGTGDLSVDAWIKTASGTNGRNTQAIVDKRVQNPPGTYFGYSLYVSTNGYLGFQLADGSFVNYNSSTNVADNTFHHVAATLDRTANVVTLYVDGVSVGAASTAGQTGTTTNTSELRIGRNSATPPGPAFFNGLIDEVELFNRALTAAEVASISGAGSAGKCKPQPQPTQPVYQFSYFSNGRQALDGHVRIVNGGSSATNNGISPDGDLCAFIYVFFKEKISECCGCLVTADGGLELSINNDLTGNPVSGPPLTKGVIKIVSATPSGGACDPDEVLAAGSGSCPGPNCATPGLGAWATHVQAQLPNQSFPVSEDEFWRATLSDSEINALQAACTAIGTVSATKGVCSCGTAQ
jgi:hypothetical protein